MNRGTLRWPRALALGGLLLWALGWSVPAAAEIWGYVDKRGVSHFADHQVDRRYELFYGGGAKSVGSSGRVPRGAVHASPSVQAVFQVSTSYKAVRHLIREAATAYGLEYELLKAVIATESGFNTRAVSPKGAIGLMQLMPDTAQRFGVKARANESLEERLTDPRTNLQAGARYLAWLLKYFDGQTELALAAYNAGEGAVLRAGRQIPNYRETQNYVRKVTQLQQSLQPPRALSQRYTTPVRTDMQARAQTPAPL